MQDLIFELPLGLKIQESSVLKNTKQEFVAKNL